ncbi:MAG: hypothetical protein GY861_18700, partial [bacterium]|nr:hypothetical protein [bacterium]
MKNKEKEYRISKRGIRQVRTIGTKRWLKRCSVDGCTKSALGKTDTCAAHGGGKSKKGILPAKFRIIEHRWTKYGNQLDVTRIKIPGPDVSLTEFLDQFQLALEAIKRRLNYSEKPPPEGRIPINLYLNWVSPDGKTVIWRTLKFRSYTSVREQILAINDRVVTHGSDQMPIDYTFNPQIFEIYAIIPAKGGAKNNNYKVTKTDKFDVLYTYYPNNKTNDCLVYILKQRLGIKKHCRKLRTMLGLKQGEKISLLSLPSIESQLDVNIDVFDLDDHLIYRNEDRDKLHHIEVVLDGEQQHFYDLIKRKLTKAQLRKKLKMNQKKYEMNRKLKNERINKKKKKEFKNLFFDIETISDVTDPCMLVPYCVGWYYFDGDKWKYQAKYGLKTSMVDFIAWILKNEVKHGPFRIIGYNSSRFHNFVLAHYANNYYEAVTIPIYANNTIYRAIINSSITWDLCQFTQTSLAQACKSFNSKTHKLEGFDHIGPQTAFDNSLFDDWLIDNKESLKKYLYNDVKSLQELFEIVSSSVQELTGAQVTSHLTIAGMGYALFSKEADFEKIKDVEMDDFFRESIIGGRTQTFIGKRHIKSKHSFKFADVNSLYPAVMLDNEFPIGSPVKVEKYVPGKLGIYRCRVTQTLLKRKLNDSVIGKLDVPCVIPYRAPGCNLDWNFREEIQVTLTSVDIECVRRAGYHVKVGTGIIFEETSTTIFDSYMKPFKARKIAEDLLKEHHSKLYNSGIRNMCKLFMNSLSGKLLERNHKYRQVFIKSEFQFNKFLTKVRLESIEAFTMGSLTYMKGENLDQARKFMPVYMGTFVYSYARSLMFDKILSKYPVYYMDTDSALVSNETYEKFTHLLGNKFGQLSDDVCKAFNSIYVVAPKSYGLFEDKKLVKFRFKGVRSTDTYDNEAGDRVTVGDI